LNLQSTSRNTAKGKIASSAARPGPGQSLAFVAVIIPRANPSPAVFCGRVTTAAIESTKTLSSTTRNNAVR
jgi:hypothetical protein